MCINMIFIKIKVDFLKTFLRRYRVEKPEVRTGS